MRPLFSLAREIRIRWRLFTALPAAIAITVALAALALPTGTASASIHGGPGSQLVSHGVSGCGAPLTLHTPKGTQADLPFSALGLPSSSDSVIGRAERQHVNWLSSLTCKSIPTVHKIVHTPHHSSATNSVASSDSENWAGYEDSVSSPNYAQAEWQVPTIGSDYNGNDYSSIWVGVGDAATSGTEMIQDGTEQDISTSNATNYYFWIELFPKEAQEEVTNLTLAPGDDVGASATYSGGNGEFVLCDYTQNECVEGSQASPAPDSHVEWIVERTEVCVNGHYEFPALASFSVATFLAGYYDLDSSGDPEYSISDGSPTQIDMVDSSGPLATPGALDDGASFEVVHNSYGNVITTSNTC